MSALGAALTTWDEFVALPDPAAGVHRELHDGAVIEMPPAAFSAGTREFWAVDLENRTIEVSLPGAAARTFGENDAVPVSVLPGAAFPVALLFR